MTVALRALVSALALGLPAGLPVFAQPAEPPPLPLVPPVAPSPASLSLSNWAFGSGDNHGMPVVVIDKVAAVVSVYDASGRLMGSEPVLVGSALGDDSVPGVGDRELSDIKPEERTTPAGRFVAGFGRSQGFGRVLWVDWPTAISLHPVVTANKAERRLERLQTETAEDNRISYGCINVSADFYRNVVEAALKDGRAIVYILPESRSVDEVFPSYAVHLRQSGRAQPL